MWGLASWDGLVLDSVVIQPGTENAGGRFPWLGFLDACEGLYGVTRMVSSMT